MFNHALQAFKFGKHCDAERLCRQILSIDARHADSLHLLRMITFQAGRCEVAAESIRRAILIDCGKAT
jgi:Tfp pilus assembly protein PilF